MGAKTSQAEAPVFSFTHYLLLGGGEEGARRGNLQADAWAGPVDTPLLQLIRGATRSQRSWQRSRMRHQLSRPGVRLDLSCDIVDASHVAVAVAVVAVAIALQRCHTATVPHSPVSVFVNFLPLPALICAAFPVQWRAQWRRQARRTRLVCWRRFAFRRN